MDRIAVIGCGGSGKTTLASKIAQRLSAPLIHLDAVYYDPEWNELPPDEFAARQQELLAQPRWVIDGNYASSLPVRLARADAVIFLDLSPVVCLWGILQRRWRFRGGQHVEQGVYDRISWSFVRYILGYRRTMRPRVRSLIAEHAAHADVVVLGSRRAARRYLDALPPRV